MPAEKVDANVDEWVNFGFDNFNDDLLTKIWLVKACRYEAEVVTLKEFYTEDVRAELSRLLHRIEYGIDVDANLAKVLELRRRENIFDDYFFDFVAQVVIHEDAKNFIVEHSH